MWSSRCKLFTTDNEDEVQCGKYVTTRTRATKCGVPGSGVWNLSFRFSKPMALLVFSHGSPMFCYQVVTLNRAAKILRRRRSDQSELHVLKFGWKNSGTVSRKFYSVLPSIFSSSHNGVFISWASLSLKRWNLIWRGWMSSEESRNRMPSLKMKEAKQLTEQGCHGRPNRITSWCYDTFEYQIT